MTQPVGMKKGFLPSRRLDGTGYNQALQEFPVKNSYGTGLFHGDPVKLSVGYLQIAGPLDKVLGIFQGYMYIDPVTKQLTQLSYFPASTSSFAPVPGAMGLGDGLGLVDVAGVNSTYILLTDASVTIAMLGEKYRVSIGAGSAITGQSGAVLAPALSVNATKGDMVRITNVYRLPDNNYGALTTGAVEVILTKPGISGSLG